MSRRSISFHYALRDYLWGVFNYMNIHVYVVKFYGMLIFATFCQSFSKGNKPPESIGLTNQFKLPNNSHVQFPYEFSAQMTSKVAYHWQGFQNHYSNCMMIVELFHKIYLNKWYWKYTFLPFLLINIIEAYYPHVNNINTILKITDMTLKNTFSALFFTDGTFVSYMYIDIVSNSWSLDFLYS